MPLHTNQDNSDFLKDYSNKQVSFDVAIKKHIKPGSRIFIDSGCSEPIDLTKKLIEMVNECKFKSQLHALLLDGIALGGFNIVDTEKLFKKTTIPVIVVMRDYPNLKKITMALKKIGMQKKIKLLEKAGEIYSYNKIHFQIMGLSLDTAKK